MYQKQGQRPLFVPVFSSLLKSAIVIIWLANILFTHAKTNIPNRWQVFLNNFESSFKKMHSNIEPIQTMFHYYEHIQLAYNFHHFICTSYGLTVNGYKEQH